VNRLLFAVGLAGLAAPTVARAQAPGTDVTPPPTTADLANAADATAAAAAVPSPPPASDETVDLAALGLDPSSGTAFDDKLNIYGFADAQYQALSFRHVALQSTRAFASGNLNVYLAKNLTPHWRFLAEVRFMYLPNGAESYAGTSTVTAAGDPNDFVRPVSWGAILIERAHIEYDVNEYLTVRAGRFLTPYGIWNIDHGPPVIISAFRPYLIGEQFFPAAQTGLDLYGNIHVGEYRVGYHATASNGRTLVDSTRDPDNSLAFGGRVEVEAPWAGTVKLGASVYGGKATDLSSTGQITDQYTERSYGVDAQWDHGGLHVQAELIGNSRRYVTGERAALSTSAFAPDGTQWGYYGLAGYRTNVLWNAMPYVYTEHERPLDKSLFGVVHTYNAGINFRPAPSVVLKLEGSFSFMRDGGLLGATNGGVNVFTGLVAWVF
jgi:hypothetical protein